MAITKEYAVAAICNGTVIDHITAGNGLRIVSALNLAERQKQVAVGINLHSNRLGLKDLIKAEERKLDPDEIAPQSTTPPTPTTSNRQKMGYLQDRRC